MKPNPYEFVEKEVTARFGDQIALRGMQFVVFMFEPYTNYVKLKEATDHLAMARKAAISCVDDATKTLGYIFYVNYSPSFKLECMGVARLAGDGGIDCSWEPSLADTE